MIRLLGTLGLLLMLAPSCATPRTPDPARKPDVTTPVERLIGRWGDPTSRLTLLSDKRYRWRSARRCAMPPCPVDLDKGRYRLERLTLVFTSSRGYGERRLQVRERWTPRRIELRAARGGRVWTLRFEGAPGGPGTR